MTRLEELKRDRLLSVVRGPLARAMLTGDYRWVATFLAGRFGVTVSAAQVGRWWKERPGGRPEAKCEDWSDGTFAMWLKNRLNAAGLLPCTPGSPFFGSLYVELHVGFLSVEETPEQLALLRRGDGSAVVRGPSTPGIERRGAIAPIDRVAARVAVGG